MAEPPRQKHASAITGDSGPATGFQDLLPIPAENPNDARDGEAAREGAPSLSHALAGDDHDTKGFAQLDHDSEVRDLGWNEPKQDIAAPLVGGMDNEELWLLLRRFDKQIYHLKEVRYPVPGGLDLNTADDEEFSPDKMRANIERLYMTIGVGILAAVKHVARLRSWRESRRTSWFLAVYSVAWLFDFIVPLLISVLIALIVYPPSRELLFPPAPMALVDGATGGIQKPRAGVLGSHDSVTGAPENHKGEAVEQEASNFVTGIAAVALSSAAGKHPQGDPDGADGSGLEVAPDPTSIVSSATDATAQAEGYKTGARHDKTKVPMETAMWTKMRPIMHALGDATDTWERFANALSPTPPFPRDTSRMRIAALVVPVLGVSLFVTSYMFMKGVTFGVGFGFFGDPVISRGLDLLNRMVPDWKKLLELRNTVLKGVPTNAQLTITLLRIGEANKAPLPPPPQINQPPADRPADLTDDELRSATAEPPLNATPAEINAAIQHDPRTAHDTGDAPDADLAKDSKHGKKTNWFLGLFKSTTRGFVRTAIGTDAVRAKTGSHHAKERLGAVPPADQVPVAGPVEFKARYNGKKGTVYLSTAATCPALSFSGSNKEKTVEIAGRERDDLRPEWTVAVSDICELKKIGGYGWKAKIVVGWSMDREVREGLEIGTTDGGRFKITAVPLRDELFNRLAAMGGQKWEAW